MPESQAKPDAMITALAMAETGRPVGVPGVGLPMAGTWDRNGSCVVVTAGETAFGPAGLRFCRAVPFTPPLGADAGRVNA